MSETPKIKKKNAKSHVEIRETKEGANMTTTYPEKVETKAVSSTVQKWGNSLAVRIPKEIADHKAFTQGKAVEITETEDGVKIVLKKRKVEYTLEELLSQCKPESRHEEINLGIVGEELI